MSVYIRDTGADIGLSPPYTQEELQYDKRWTEPGEQFQLNLSTDSISPGAVIRLVGDGVRRRLGTATGDHQRILGNLPNSPGSYDVTVGGTVKDSIRVHDMSESDEGAPSPFDGQEGVGVAGDDDQNAQPDDDTDPADLPGRVNADNERGWSWAPAVRDALGLDGGDGGGDGSSSLPVGGIVVAAVLGVFLWGWV